VRLPSRRLDALGLVLAGVANTILAPIDFAALIDRGSLAHGGAVADRAQWIAAHTSRWQGGWAFWFVVTLSFAWAFFALANHVERRGPELQLALALAVIGAAVDCVGIVTNLAAVPTAADSGGETFRVVQELARALTDVAAFGLYALAGLVLLPVLASTRAYPRWLLGLAALEWGVAAIATVLLAVQAPGAAAATALAGAAFVLYAPWAWANAWWVLRRTPGTMNGTRS
jgi:hypothetical protein